MAALLVAVAEMALAGDVGVALISARGRLPRFWFGEDQARYVLAVRDAAALLAAARPPACRRAARAHGGDGFDTAGRHHHID